MAKKVQAYVKLQVAAGMANPSPPVGPALGQQGVNIMEFCKAFNARTESLEKGLPNSGCYYCLCRPFIYVCYKNPTGSSFIEKSSRYQIWFW